MIPERIESDFIHFNWTTVYTKYVLSQPSEHLEDKFHCNIRFYCPFQHCFLGIFLKKSSFYSPAPHSPFWAEIAGFLQYISVSAKRLGQEGRKYLAPITFEGEFEVESNRLLIQKFSRTGEILHSNCWIFTKQWKLDLCFSVLLNKETQHNSLR